MLRIKQDIRNSILLRMLRRLKKAMYRFKKFSQKDYTFRFGNDNNEFLWKTKVLKSIGNHSDHINYDSLISS